MKRLITLLLILTVPMLSCAVLDGSGITNNIPKYYSETSIGISSLTDNGTDLSVPAGYKIDGVDISALSSGNVTGTGTTNTITKFTGAATIGNSNITDNGTHISTSKQIISTLPNGTPPFQVASGSWVGNLNVDQVDGIEGSVITDHNLRHEFLGDDEIVINNQVIFRLLDFYSGIHDTNFYTTTLTGGRGVVYPAYTQIYIAGGNVANDVIGYVESSGFYVNNSNASFRPKAFFHWQPNTTTSKTEIWVGLFSDTTTFPTTTSNHIGFRLIETAGAGDGNGILYASNGNGVAGTQTVIGTSNYAQYSTLQTGFNYGATNIKYYLGNPQTLAATHATNIPSGVNLYWGIWVKTTEGVSKVASLWNERFINGE